jgi:hypothetical protein
MGGEAAMTIFDLADVSTFVADLDAQMDHCDNSGCWVSPRPWVGKATGMLDVMNVAASDLRPDIVSSLPPQLGEA